MGEEGKHREPKQWNTKHRGLTTKFLKHGASGTSTILTSCPKIQQLFGNT